MRVLGGSDGLHRTVLWAHACEMADPTEALSPNELMMTVGLCIPDDAVGQAALVTRLADAGLAGIVLGEQETLPHISPEMLKEADSRAFPIVLAASNVFFSAIARHVASANSSSRLLEVTKLSKLYHLAAAVDDDLAAFLEGSARLLRMGLQVCDGPTSLRLFSADPGMTKADTRQRSYPLNGTHPAQLTITEYPGEEVESLVLVHLLKILELSVDRILDRADKRCEVAMDLMSALLNGFGGHVEHKISKFLGADRATTAFKVAAFPHEDADTVSRAVAIRRLPVIVGLGRIGHLALIPTSAISEFQALLSTLEVRAGVSSTFNDYVDTRTASDEASRVLTATVNGGQRWVEYEGSTISVLARSHREAEEIIDGVLGSLGRDDQRSNLLRDTLFTYLRNDRRWSECAAELGIHRQTLAHRLRRIEDLISVDLSRTPDLAVLWIAYQAWVSVRS